MKNFFQIVRAILVVILATVLFVVGLVGIPASAIALRLTNPQTVVQPLTSQEVYQNAGRALHLAVIQRGDSFKVNDDLPLPVVEKIVSRAITPEIFSNTLTESVNATYDWLTGKSFSPQFTINPLAQQTNLPAVMASAIVEYVNSLPACSPDPATPVTINALDIVGELTCNPGTITEASIREQVDKSGAAVELARQASFSSTQIPVTSEVTQRAQLIFFIVSLLPIAVLAAIVALVLLMLLVQFNVRKWLRTAGTVITVFSGLALLVVLAGYIENSFLLNTVVPNLLTSSPSLIYYKLGPQQILSSLYSSVLITTLVAGTAALLIGVLMLLEAWVMQQKSDYRASHRTTSHKTT